MNTKSANSYGQALLSSLRSPELSMRDRIVVAYKLGLVSKFESKLAYKKYRQVEETLTRFAMESFK